VEKLMKVLIACGAGFHWSGTGAAHHPQHGRTVENRSIVTSPFTVPEREVVTLRLRVGGSKAGRGEIKRDVEPWTLARCAP
jgi:hypothetical protein